MSDYDKAMLHVELALRRTCDALRKRGETNIEDALWIVAGEIATLAEEKRRSTTLPHDGKAQP